MSQVSAQQLPDVQRFAVDTARRIADRPYTIIVTRDNGDGDVVTLAPQVVRVEVVQNIRSGVELRDALVAISKQYVVLIGYKDHPTIPNTNLLRADVFMFQNRQYEVIEIIDTVPGRLLASADLKP